MPTWCLRSQWLWQHSVHIVIIMQTSCPRSQWIRQHACQHVVNNYADIVSMCSPQLQEHENFANFLKKLKNFSKSLWLLYEGPRYIFFNQIQGREDSTWSTKWTGKNGFANFFFFAKIFYCKVQSKQTTDIIVYSTAVQSTDTMYLYSDDEQEQTNYKQHTVHCKL